MILSLTKNPEPVVEGDDDDPAEGGEDPGVVEVRRAPGPGLAVHKHQHSQLWTSDQWMLDISFKSYICLFATNIWKHASWLL